MTIQTPEPSEKVRVQYKIRTPLDLFLARDLVPVTIVDDLSGPSVGDRGYPRDAMGFNNVAAGGVGTRAQCVLVGTGNRGKVYQVTRGIIEKPTAGIVQIRFSLGADITGLVDQTNKGFVDQRISNDAPDLSMQGSTPLLAALDGTVVGRVSVEADISYPVPLTVVFGFGGFLNFVSAADDEELAVTWYWTEYLLEDR